MATTTSTESLGHSACRLMPEKKSLPGRVALLLAGAVLLALVIVFVQGREPANTGEPWKEFSGAKALAHVQALVDLGPRPAGSEAIKNPVPTSRKNSSALAGK